MPHEKYTRSFEPQKSDLNPGNPHHELSQQHNPVSHGIGGKGLKLNIEGVSRNAVQGYHDEFYSHL